VVTADLTEILEKELGRAVTKPDNGYGFWFRSVKELI